MITSPRRDGAVARAAMATKPKAHDGIAHSLLTHHWNCTWVAKRRRSQTHVRSCLRNTAALCPAVCKRRSATDGTGSQIVALLARSQALTFVHPKTLCVKPLRRAGMAGASKRAACLRQPCSAFAHRVLLVIVPHAADGPGAHMHAKQGFITQQSPTAPVLTTQGLG